MLGQRLFTLGTPLNALGLPFGALGQSFGVLGLPFFAHGRPVGTPGRSCGALGPPVCSPGRSFGVLGRPFFPFGLLFDTPGRSLNGLGHSVFALERIIPTHRLQFDVPSLGLATPGSPFPYDHNLPERSGYRPRTYLDQRQLPNLSVNTPAIALTTFILILGTPSPLSAVDLRETQFPAELPKTIIVAGADYNAGEWLKPWVARDLAEYAGKYDSHTITDGRAQLELKLHQAKSSEGDMRWHVDGTLETKVGLGVSHVASFKNAELMEPKQPCFDVIDRLTPALFVMFTNPDDKKNQPRPAVVIGNQVFVRKE